MRIPIPQDWNGEDWTCLQIQWPNSPMWRAILSGLLTMPTWGKYWDEKTGSIKGVQGIGREIWFRSFPYVTCAGDDVPIEGELPVGGGILCLDESDYDMACLDVSKSLKIENNTLYALNSCCEWVAIGEVGSQTDAPTVVIPPDIDTEATGIFPCGKATKLAEFLVEFGDEAWDESDNQLPVLFVRYMQNFLGVDLKNTWTQNLQNQALIMKGVIIPSAGLVDIDKSEVLPEGLVDQLICKFLPILTDTEDDDEDKIWTAYTNAIDVIFPIGSVPDGLIINNFWSILGQAVGRTLMHDLAQSGAYIPEDCDCADGSPTVYPPYDGLVYWSGEFSINTETGGCTWSDPVQKSLNILELEITGGVNENFQEGQIALGLKALGTVREIEIEFPLNSVTIPGYYPADQYNDANPTQLAEYIKPTTNEVAPTYTYTPTTEKQVLVITFPAPVDLEGNVIVVHTKLNPKDQDPLNNVFNWDARITYAGDIR